MSDRHVPGGPGVEAILAPYRGIEPALSVAIEAANGVRVAGTSAEPVPIENVAHRIVAGPLTGGRVVGWGPLAGTPLANAGVASMAVALGIARSVSTAEIADVAGSRLIDQELALGRELQRSFVGLVGPKIPGYDLACHYEQAHEVGGDFFDAFRLAGRGRPLSLVVADVTGKGIAAALLMAFARPLIHAALDNAGGPAEALERTNRVLLERRASLFITALCATLTLSTGRLRLANAGHEPPLLVPRDGSAISVLEGSGPLLGAFPSLDLVETVATLSPGDAVVLYTDGVTDARSATGERFGDDRLLSAVEAARGRSAGAIVESVTGAVDRFQGGTPPADDVTLLVIARRARAIRAGRPPAG